MCDTLVIVEDKRVFFAKNSDRDPNEAQLLEWIPAKTHAAGSRLRCTWIEIPQVEKTHAVLLSRPYWMWGAEMGTNEFGVTIGNEAVFTDARYEKIGLTGMDILRLALERSASASQAVETIRTLIQKVGQGGGCGHENRAFTYHNSFLVADPTTAFVVESAGREVATERVKGVRSISNGLTIPDFARAHSDRLRSTVAACEARRAQTETGGQSVEKAADLARVLRGHGAADWPTYRFLNGTLGVPCMHGGGAVASSLTTASWIAELSQQGCRHWATATSSPCLALFKPVSIQEAVDLGPAATDEWDPESLWWQHEKLHRLVMRDPARLAPLFLADRDALEAEFFLEKRSSSEAFQMARAALTEWTARVEDALEKEGAKKDVRPFFARRYWRTRNIRAGLFQGALEKKGEREGTVKPASA
jgi:dipeptidase